MLIWALDLATQMGWASGEPGGTLTYGSVRLSREGGDEFDIGASALRFLGEHWIAFRPDVVVIEAPMNSAQAGKMTNARTQLILQGLYFQCGSMARRLGVPRVTVANVQTVRKHFVGQGRPQNPKLAVMNRCRLLGFKPQDDNAADAIALWDYAASILLPRAAHINTALFRG
jgi:hypothetical protein